MPMFELCTTGTKKQTLRSALVGIVIKDDRIPMKIENTRLSLSGSSSVYRDQSHNRKKTLLKTAFSRPNFVHHITEKIISPKTVEP